jgi:hypothetical protein
LNLFNLERNIFYLLFYGKVMKNLLNLLIIFLIIIFLIQPSVSQTLNVKVQIINNVPDSNLGNLSVSVNGVSKSGTNGLAFRQATAFFEVIGLSDFVEVTYNGNNHKFNVPPAGDGVIFIYTGVLEPAKFDNPFNRTNLTMNQYAGMYAEVAGSLGKVALTFFQGTTDAPSLNVIDRSNNEKWASKIDYFNWSGYVSSPDKNPKLYEIELRSSIVDTVVGAYRVDLTHFANKALCLFTSGFVDPEKNQKEPAFGLFAADADGNVIEFASINVKIKPSVPTLLFPLDNALGQSKSGNLNWEAVSGSKTYNLQVSKSTNFVQNIIDKNNLTSTNYPYKNLESESQYFWRVSATNEYGTSDWSAIRSFTIKKEMPGKPSLCYPANNSTELDITGSIRWNKISGAESYSLELATDEDFQYLTIDSTNITDTICNYSKLKYNKLYYWQIVGKNSVGEGEWSDTWTFKTKENTTVSETENSKNIIISPNPAKDYIYIQPSEGWKPSEGSEIQIFDMLGINVSSADGGIKLGGIIDISKLSSGIYFIKIGNRVEKFVKM